MGQPSTEVKQAWLENNRHKRPEINKNSRLRLYYGITPENRVELIEQQDGKCAICKKAFGNDKVNTPHVDHNHDTRWVRGMLCTVCNSGIGMFKDDIDVLQSAIEYLISNATPTEFVFAPVRVLRKTNAGRKLDPEWCENIRKSKLGHIPWNKGGTFSDETKEKMSKSAKKRWANGSDSRE